MAALHHTQGANASSIDSIATHPAKHVLPRRPASTPERLTPIVPPANFGAVQENVLYRSAFPQASNVSFMRTMDLKTILCLVDTELSSECSELVTGNKINRLRIDIAPNKEGKVSSSLESIYHALLVVMDVTNYPLLVHCNQGRHRTGCVIACLRRMQNWPLEDIMIEYDTYANPKAREGDQKLIASFNPEAMLDYIKNNVQFEHRPSLMQLLRSDLVDVSTLVKILASTDGVSRSHMSLKSNTSSKADSGVDFGLPVIEETDKLPAVSSLTVQEQVEVSVEECGPMSPPVEKEGVLLG